jgi:hypothetical protein
MNYYIKDFSWQLEKEGVSFKGELVTSANLSCRGEKRLSGKQTAVQRKCAF